MGKRSKTPRSVRVEDIESEEGKKSPLVDSILRRTNKLFRYRFVFDVGGNLVERTYEHFNGPEVRKGGSFSKLVKVFFTDGSWKYAIKGFRAISETTRMELVSLYAGKLRNPSTGKWEWPGTLYASQAPDDAVGKMVPFYNEEIESAVKTGNFNKKFKSRDEAVGYGMIYKYVNSTGSRLYLNRWMNALTMSQTMGHDAGKQVAGLGEEMVVYKPQYSQPPAGYEKWKKCAPRFFTYRRDEYIKSYYKPKQKTIWKPELFYLEDLLAIYDEYTQWDVGQEDSAMVWNSLDATCRGNV
jgi:hypothetical protein